MKEYTVVVNCKLVDTFVEDDDAEAIIRSDLYKQRIKEWIKVDGNVDDVDIVSVKVFVRDLEDKKDEE